MGLPHGPAEGEILDAVDEVGGQGDGNQGEGDAGQGDIAEGEEQDHQIGEQVRAGQPPPAAPGNGEGQGIVTAAGPALPHNDAHSDAHKQGARQGRHQRMAGQVGQHGRELFPQLVKQGHAEGGNGGNLDEAAAQILEGQQITAQVQHRSDEGGGNPQPVLDEQHQANDAALGDAGLLVNVVDAKGGDHGPQKDEPHPPEGDSLSQTAEPDGYGAARHTNSSCIAD